MPDPVMFPEHLDASAETFEMDATSCPTSSDKGSFVSSNLKTGVTLTRTTVWEVKTRGCVHAVEFHANGELLFTAEHMPWKLNLHPSQLPAGNVKIGIVLIVSLPVGKIVVDLGTIKNEPPKPPKPPHPPSPPIWLGDMSTGDYSQWEGGVQVGRNYPNPSDTSNWSYRKTPQQQIPIERNPHAPHGYVAHVKLDSGDYAYDTTHEACFMLHSSDQGQGSHFFMGWSMIVPSSYRGSNGWGTLWEWQTLDWWNFPTYGIFSVDMRDADQIQLVNHFGHTPDRGSGDYTPEYNWEGPILSPVPKDVRIDFIMEWLLSAYWGPPRDSQVAGIMRCWLRVQGESDYALLYSNVPGDNARVQMPRHPTWIWNSHGSPLATIEMGFYSADTEWTREYLTWGWVEAESFEAVAASLG